MSLNMPELDRSLCCERNAANVMRGAVVCASTAALVAIILISIPMFAHGVGLTVANIGTVAIPTAPRRMMPIVTIARLTDAVPSLSTSGRHQPKKRHAINTAIFLDGLINS
jgi:hypothetical protein